MSTVDDSHHQSPYHGHHAHHLSGAGSGVTNSMLVNGTGGPQSLKRKKGRKPKSLDGSGSNGNSGTSLHLNSNGTSNGHPTTTKRKSRESKLTNK